MNTHSNSNPAVDPIVAKTVHVLQQWEAQVEPLQAQKLQAARHIALGQPASSTPRWIGWQGAVLATLVVGITLSTLMPHFSHPIKSPVIAQESAELKGLDPELQDLLDDDLDLSLTLSGLNDES